MRFEPGRLALLSFTSGNCLGNVRFEPRRLALLVLLPVTVHVMCVVNPGVSHYLYYFR